MKQINGIIRIVSAVLFAFVLSAGYSLTKETTGQLIGHKIISPIIYDWLAILPKDHYSPWHYIVGLVTFLLAVIPTSLLCGLFFGYFFRERTVLWSIIPSSGLIAYFVKSLSNHMYFWTVYFEYALLLISFALCSIVASKYYKALNAKAVNETNYNPKLKQYYITSAMIISAVFLGWLHFYYPLIGTLVKGEGFEGIILNKEFEYNPKDWWTIEDKDIRVLEDHLRNYVKTHEYRLTSRLVNELPSYRRWYNPEISKTGERQIHVFLMHKSHVSRSTWLHVFFGVAGGGDAFWHMTYIVKDGSFENVMGNADA